MEVKFKKIGIKAEQIDNNKYENPFHETKYTKPIDFEYQLETCICWHHICGHRFMNEKNKAGKCDYPNCSCEEYKQGDVDIFDFIREVDNENIRKYEGGLF